MTPLPFRREPPDRSDAVLRHGFGFDPEGSRWDTPEPERCWPPTLDQLPLAERRDRPTWRWITRSDLFDLGAQANSADRVLQTYVAVAVWGTAWSARSRRRALKPLREHSAAGQLDQVSENLSKAVHLATHESLEAAYEALHGVRSTPPPPPGEDTESGGLRVDWLGPAYGTKLLYFAAYDACTAAGRMPPLILDSNVAGAVNWLTGTDWPSGNWLPATYAAYLKLASSWADQWGTTPDVIERVLFAVGQSDRLGVTSLAPVPSPAQATTRGV